MMFYLTNQEEKQGYNKAEKHTSMMIILATSEMGLNMWKLYTIC